MRLVYLISHFLSLVMFVHNPVSGLGLFGCLAVPCVYDFVYISPCANADVIQCACSNTAEQQDIETCIKPRCSASNYEQFLLAMESCPEFSSEPTSSRPTSLPPVVPIVPETTSSPAAPSQASSSPPLSTHASATSPQPGSTVAFPVVRSKTSDTTSGPSVGNADVPGATPSNLLQTSYTSHSPDIPATTSSALWTSLDVPSPTLVTATDTLAFLSSTSDSSASLSPSQSSTSQRGNSPKASTVIIVLLSFASTTFVGGVLHICVRRLNRRRAGRTPRPDTTEHDDEATRGPGQKYEYDGAPAEEEPHAASLRTVYPVHGAAASTPASSIRVSTLVHTATSPGCCTPHSDFCESARSIAMNGTLDPRTLGWTSAETASLGATQTGPVCGAATPSTSTVGEGGGLERGSNISVDAISSLPADSGLAFVTDRELAERANRGITTRAFTRLSPLDVCAGGMAKAATSTLRRDPGQVVDETRSARRYADATPVSSLHSSHRGLSGAVPSTASSRFSSGPREPARFVTVLMEVGQGGSEELDQPPPYEASGEQLDTISSCVSLGKGASDVGTL